MPRAKTQAPLRAKQDTQESSAETVDIQRQGDEVNLTVDTRRYRVRGLEKNYTARQLRVNLLASRDELVHLDTLDLCQARSRQAFIKAAAAELFVDELTIKKDVGRLLLELERLQDERLRAAMELEETQVDLTPDQRQAAEELLESPQLVDRILSDLEACGLVGEGSGKLICYLACVSRKLRQPLAVLIQSGSAAGKTSLMDAVLAFMPEEEQLRYSALTSQSLYYMGRQNLKHKILAVAEEEGVEQASYALKLLQSDGRLQIAAAGKDSGTGRQQTESYTVEGPVMMLLTTTAEEPDPELQNRCLTLHVNESPEQTHAIHARQRSVYTLQGQAEAGRREALCELHQNAQRLLDPVAVVIPWAEQLTFRHDQTRMRRDHAKYLSLIAAITLLHQRQRERLTKTVAGHVIEYVESSLEDVALANRLASEVLGQSLDGLLPQTRQLLALVDSYVTERSTAESLPRGVVRFTQRELREALSWGDFQLRKHLARLVSLEYVVAHRTGNGNQKQYELLYNGEGRQGEKFLLGLKSPSELSAAPSLVSNDRLATSSEPAKSPQRCGKDRPSMATKTASKRRGSKDLPQRNGRAAKQNKRTAK